MADAVVGAVVLIAFVVGVVVTVRVYNTRRTALRRPPNLWRLDERTEAGMDERPVLAVYCTRAGSEELFCGSARWGDPDFDEQLEEARVQGEVKLSTLNRPLKAVRR